MNILDENFGMIVDGNKYVVFDDKNELEEMKKVCSIDVRKSTCYPALFLRFNISKSIRVISKEDYSELTKYQDQVDDLIWQQKLLNRINLVKCRNLIRVEEDL